MLEDASALKAKRSLAAVVREERAVRAFAVADAVDLALDVCEVLANAHAEGIVHGDLGPHSVRIAWPRVDGRLKAIEIFSLERESEEDDASLSGAVLALQTPFAPNGLAASGARPPPSHGPARSSPFHAPEQRPGAGTSVDPRADIWSIGALLRWMLRLDTKTATAPRGTPSPALLTAIEQCLALDPTQRPQTVDELAEKIASFASDPPVRFARLAERRQAIEEAKRAPREKKDAMTALERLEANAIHREREALTQPPACDDKRGWSAAAPDRLLDTLGRVAAVVPETPRAFPKRSALDSSQEIAVADESDIFEVDDEEQETRVAISPNEDVLSRPLPRTPLLAPSALSDGELRASSHPSISPMSVSIEATPLPLRPEQVPGYGGPAPQIRAQLKTDPDARALRKRGRTVLAFAAAAFATIAVGVGVGVGTSLLTPSASRAVAAAPPPAPSPLPKAESTAKAESAAPSAVTPASLPNAKEAIPTMTPSALPNAPPRVHKVRVPKADKADGDVLEDGIGQ